MEDNAILHAKVDELNTMKEHVLELEGYKQKAEELTKEENRLSKAVSSKERDIAEEIDTTLKKRRNEIKDSYESQLDTQNARLKKAKEKKEKEKAGKVSERITAETAEYREKNNAFQEEIKAIMKTNKMPKLCNTNFFHALFKPKSLKEILGLILILAIAFLGIPCGLYFLLLRDGGELALALIYLIDVIVFGGAYLLLNNLVKEKYLTEIANISRIRAEIRNNEKQIKLIKKGIQSDQDESGYGLEQYDSEISEINDEIARIASEEKEALTKFDNETSAVITSEIKERHQGELTALKESHDVVAKDQKETTDKVKELSLMISKQYETYLGKDMMNTAVIDRLIGYIESGEAANIGEAVAKERNKDKK